MNDREQQIVDEYVARRNLGEPPEALRNELAPSAAPDSVLSSRLEAAEETFDFEYRVSEESIARSARRVLPQLTAAPQPAPRAGRAPDRAPIRRRPVFAFAMAAGALCLVLFGWSEVFFTPRFRLAAIPADAISQTRGADAFDGGLVMYNSGLYASAARAFSGAARTAADPRDAARAHIFSGMAWMRSAERTTLGLFPRFDRESVAHALDEFRDAAPDGTVEPALSDARYFAATASIALGDEERARTILATLAHGDGPRSRDAQRLLTTIGE
jgi:hypothetical protein